MAFSLRYEDVSEPFTIHTQPGGHGSILITEPLDFEATESYTLTVIVEDLAQPPRSEETTVNVTVINVNDNPPVFVGDRGDPVDNFSLVLLEEIPYPFTLLVLQVCSEVFPP